MQFRKEYFADERDDNLKQIGRPHRRQDIEGHVTGRSLFFDDRHFAGMLYVKCVRSPHHHARIRAIDTAAAERMPGVKRILRSDDVPKKLNTILGIFGFGIDDEPTLAFDKVRYKGEPVVAVLADSERAAQEAAARVRVDYSELPAVFDVEEAMREGAPLVNEYHGRNWFTYWERYDCQQIRFGDVEKGFAEADHVLEERYQMSPIEHAPTETNGAIAAPADDGRFVCYTSTQALFFSLDNVAVVLDIPTNKLHFIGGTVGGGFGGKVDTVVEPIAVLGAMVTGRPVRYVFSREEEMQTSSPRGAERLYIKDGVMNDGRIVARQVRHYHDSGAYARLSTYGTVKSAAHMPGPYTIPNVRVDSYCVFTNRTPSSAMRGFGVTGGDFALEIQMDKLARLIGMDPMEFRIVNAYRDGDMKAHRKVTEGAALIECVQAASELANWPIREEFRRTSSREGGGGERRARVPETPRQAAAATRPTYTPTPSLYRPEPQHAQPPPPPPPQPERPPEPVRSPQSAASRHGAARFSSVFGTRRR